MKPSSEELKLLDEFAIPALPSLIINNPRISDWIWGDAREKLAKNLGEAAYRIAEGMLAARKERE